MFWSGPPAAGGGGAPLPPATPLCRQLRRHGAVNVLVEPAGVRAGVGTEAPVRVLHPALLDVGIVRVAVVALAWVRAGDHVAPIGPGAVRETRNRADVEIIATEGDRTTAELL